MGVLELSHFGRTTVDERACLGFHVGEVRWLPIFHSVHDALDLVIVHGERAADDDVEDEQEEADPDQVHGAVQGKEVVEVLCECVHGYLPRRTVAATSKMK